MRENDLIDAGEPDIWHVSYYQMVRDNIGNIIAIYSEYGDKVFEAEYDAWGRQTSKIEPAPQHVKSCGAGLFLLFLRILFP